MRGRSFTAGLAVVTILTILPSTPIVAQEGEAPSFWVENSTVEIDRVIAGRIASATFVFHNDSPEDVHIIRAKPS